MSSRAVASAPRADPRHGVAADGEALDARPDGSDHAGDLAAGREGPPRSENGSSPSAESTSRKLSPVGAH
jgi:hypothetical protein